MFKGKSNMPSMPSVPGFKKRSTATAGDGAVVSSAPVGIDPTANPSISVAGNGDITGNAIDGDTTSPAMAADTQKGGKFKGMFKRGSGKAKKDAPAKGISVKGKGKGKGIFGRGSSGKGTPTKGSSASDEDEVTDQMGQMELSDEPVLGGESAAASRPIQYSQQPSPVQHTQPPAGASGILPTHVLLQFSLLCSTCHMSGRQRYHDGPKP